MIKLTHLFTAFGSLLPCSLLLTFSVHANQVSSELELNAQKAAANFSAFIYFEGQGSYVDTALTLAKQGLSITEQEVSNETEKTALIAQWQMAIDYIEKHRGAIFNGEDQSLEINWGLITLKLIEQIQAAQQQEKQQQPKNTELLIQLEIQSILAQYIASANSTTGVFGSAYKDVKIEDKVERASQLINSLADTDSNRKVKQKWQYIKKTILDYNSNLAPYIVIKTINKIDQLLAQSTDKKIAAD